MLADLLDYDYIARHGHRHVEYDRTQSYLTKIRQTKPHVLSRLKQKQWVKERKVGDEIHYRLTTNGTIASLQLRIARETHILPNGQWIEVVFDVPEVTRRERDHLRRMLKRMGFKKFQQSCWYTECAVGDPLVEFFRLSKFSTWAKIFIAKELK